MIDARLVAALSAQDDLVSAIRVVARYNPPQNQMGTEVAAALLRMEGAKQNSLWDDPAYLARTIRTAQDVIAAVRSVLHEA